MKIAVATNEKNLLGKIPDTLAEARYILIVDLDKMEIVDFLDGEQKNDRALAFAQFVVRWDCEVIICGAIEEQPFVILADEGCVTRHLGAGLTAAEAIDRMTAYELEYIRDYIGGSGCSSEGQENLVDLHCPNSH